MEQSVLRMLDGMISTTDDPTIQQELEHHKIETEGHALRMKGRLQAHGAAPSTVRQLGGILGALAKMPLDLVRGEKAGRNARDGYATEHMEIASYELLKRVAQRAGDDETVTRLRRDHRTGAGDGRSDRRQLGHVRRAQPARRRRDGRLRAAVTRTITAARARGTARCPCSRSAPRAAR